MSQEAYKLFLEGLRKKRLASKLTQAQVAEGIKLSRAQYTAIEQGRSMLNWRHLYNLAAFYKTSFTIKC